MSLDGASGLLNLGRLNWFRLGYISAEVWGPRQSRASILINGVEARDRIRLGSLAIHDIINDEPNTCDFLCDGTRPTMGQTIRVTVNQNDPVLLFTGTLEQVYESYEGKPAQLAWKVHCIDDTARVNRRMVFGTYTNVSATTIAQDVVSKFAPGFGSAYVQAGLPLVTVLFDGSEGSLNGCLRALAKLIGGYFYWEDAQLHFFETEATNTPDPIDSSHKFLNDPPINVNVERSQLRTRTYGRGHGESALSALAVGETMIPIADASMFSPDGGKAWVDGQILTYLGTFLGGGGTLIGPGVAPSAAPTVATAGGSGLGTGIYQYAYTWVTAGGETTPSPLASAQTGNAIDPSPPGPSGTTFSSWADTRYYSNQAGLHIGDVLDFAVSFSWTEDMGVGFTNVIAMPAGHITVPASATAGQPALMYYSASGGRPWSANYMQVWMSTNGGAFWRVGSQNIAGQGTTFTLNPTYVWQRDYSPPPAASWNLHQVTRSGIAVGPTGTTARKVYRTAAGGSQLKLLATVADNTTTGLANDTTPDASLGANAPTSDTSGLSGATGQVNAGSATIPVASLAPFNNPGWVVIGSQVVRFSGTTTTAGGAMTLNNVPATGPGALTATVPYNTVITAAPMLVGVPTSGAGSITAPINRGDPVSIWIQRDDTAAQAVAAGADADSNAGIYEHLIVDERRGIPSLTAVCDADLALYSYPIATVQYATRDAKTKSGKPITVNLTSPAINRTLRIQDVNISEIDVAPGVLPRFQVSASSLRFSLEDILRRIAGEVLNDVT